MFWRQANVNQTITVEAKIQQKAQPAMNEALGQGVTNDEAVKHGSGDAAGQVGERQEGMFEKVGSPLVTALRRIRIMAVL